jgi:hypothetical protein
LTIYFKYFTNLKKLKEFSHAEKKESNQVPPT